MWWRMIRMLGCKSISLGNRNRPQGFEQVSLSCVSFETQLGAGLAEAGHDHSSVTF